MVDGCVLDLNHHKPTYVDSRYQLVNDKDDGLKLDLSEVYE